jgi:site-specific DNA recombinase
MTNAAPTDTGTAVELGIDYLRVSSKRQMDTAADVDPDGNSINTQREYCQDKARSMKVVVQKEFIEPGTSAQSIEKRPVFRELLAYLKAHPEIRYVFIYMRSRAFRNFTDAAITKRALDKMGVKLISAKEDFGEGIMADAMEAVTDIMNEVQVRMSGQDIATKMANKARNGGTNGLAKLGYLNERILVDGRKVNSIVVDQERAPLVVQGFELFGTGKHTLDTLLEILTDSGLRAPHRNKPITRDTLNRMLRDRYYIGKLVYKGIEYQGRHESLVSEELFDRVQRVLDAHSGSGTRLRQHPHYLKGVVWCGRCKHRFTIMPGRGNGGTYFYFLCRGRQLKQCDHPYVPVDVMEQVVTEHYAVAVRLLVEVRTAVRTGVQAAMPEHYELSEELREQFTTQLEKLDRKESYFLDLAAEEGWPKDKLRAKIQAIRDDQTKLTRQLAQATNQLETGRQIFLHALALLDNPHEMYQAGNETVRSILNRAFFTKLYIEGRRVTGHEMAEPFDVISEAYTIYRDAKADRAARDGDRGASDNVRTHYRRVGVTSRTAELTTGSDGAELLAWPEGPQAAKSADLLVETGAPSRMTRIDSLALALTGHGSSKAVLVGTTGFEPATP